jgi:nucleoside-diphosphate-sugar epimerase
MFRTGPELEQKGQNRPIYGHIADKIGTVGSRSAISHAPERPGDVKHSLASIGKLRAAGFVPGGNFNQGIQETIDFLKQPQP